VEDTPPPTAGTPNAKPRASTYIGRALRLRCPECGQHPIFVPLKRVRSLFDWVYPLDGCPRCGYAYEREEGYFLLAIWGLNYGLIAGGGMAVGLLLLAYSTLKMWEVLVLLTVTMPIASFLFVRHAKALYLAMDHYFDPHVKARRNPQDEAAERRKE
jgi:uncharacterized protein (DUF983 family)